jgi:hypothetical protein
LSARALAAGLGAARLGIGAGLWLAPRQALGALGFDRIDATGLALARIAATRDLVLGAWQLAASADERERRRASLACAVSDGGDAVAFWLALKEGSAQEAGRRGLAAALPATLAGLWLTGRSG